MFRNDYNLFAAFGPNSLYTVFKRMIKTKYIREKIKIYLAIDSHLAQFRLNSNSATMAATIVMRDP